MTIEATDKLSGLVWRNEFTDARIEYITQEAGSMKKFEIFTKMLNSAFESSNESVCIDILT